jgi:hypothetical protein
MDARAAAVHKLFKRAGLPIEVLDELHLRIMLGTLIQPWRRIGAISSGRPRTIGDRPAGSHGGARKLIEDMRRTSASQSQPRDGTVIQADNVVQIAWFTPQGRG